MHYGEYRVWLFQKLTMWVPLTVFLVTLLIIKYFDIEMYCYRYVYSYVVVGKGVLQILWGISPRSGPDIAHMVIKSYCKPANDSVCDILAN